MKYFNNKSRGFALLYAILIMFLFMITVSAIMFSALADIRQYKQAKSSLGALMAAQSGIEYGIATGKSSSGGCSLFTGYIDSNVHEKGIYNLNICPDKKYVESTGIFGGVKIKLQADNYDTNPVIYQVGI